MRLPEIAPDTEVARYVPFAAVRDCDLEAFDVNRR
jgi:hypothetical protein